MASIRVVGLSSWGVEWLGGFLVVERLGDAAKVGEGAQRSLLLLASQPADDLAHLAAPDHVDLIEKLAAGVRRGNLYDAPVVIQSRSLDEIALHHPFDDAGHVRERDAESIGETAHRHAAVAAQQVQHVQLRRADLAETAMLDYGPALPRNERLELFEDRVDDLCARVRRRRLCWFTFD
jgi:hypothetical protein